MKTLLLTIALVCTINAKAQSEAPGIIWNKDIAASVSSSFNPESIVKLSDGSILIMSNIFVDGIIIPEITKVSSTGEKIWQKTYPNLSSYYIFSGIVDNSGNIFAVIEATSSSDASYVKLDSLGSFIWKKNVKIENYETYISRLEALADNSILMSLDFESEDGSGAESGFSFAKYDTNGNQQWIKTKKYQDIPNSYGAAISAKDGGFFIVGSTGQVDGDEVGYIAKFDAQRNLLWEKEIDINTVNDTYFYDAIVNTNGDLMIAGVYELNNGNENYFVSKISNNGTEVWRKIYSLGSLDITSLKLLEFSPNEYTLAFESNGDDSNTRVGHLKKIDNSGNTVWEHSYKNEIFNGLVDFVDIIKTTDNNLLMLTQKYNNSDKVDAKYGLYKMGGSLAVADIKSKAVSIYPNPSSHFINIKHEPTETINKYELYNLSGQLIEEQKDPSSTISIKKLNSGTYIIRLYIGKNIYTEKIIKN